MNIIGFERTRGTTLTEFELADFLEIPTILGTNPHETRIFKGNLNILNTNYKYYKSELDPYGNIGTGVDLFAGDVWAPTSGSVSREIQLHHSANPKPPIVIDVTGREPEPLPVTTPDTILVEIVLSDVEARKNIQVIEDMARYIASQNCAVLPIDPLRRFGLPSDDIAVDAFRAALSRSGAQFASELQEAFEEKADQAFYGLLPDAVVEINADRIVTITSFETIANRDFFAHFAPEGLTERVQDRRQDSSWSVVIIDGDEASKRQLKKCQRSFTERLQAETHSALTTSPNGTNGADVNLFTTTGGFKAQFPYTTVV